MTKRKTTTKQAPQASTESVESVEATVASKPKQANTTAKKASTGGRRGRPKKMVVQLQTTSEAVHKLAEVVVAVKDEVIKVTESRTLYERVAAWLTYKLYQITSPFRGY